MDFNISLIAVFSTWGIILIGFAIEILVYNHLLNSVSYDEGWMHRADKMRKAFGIYNIIAKAVFCAPLAFIIGQMLHKISISCC